jgi:hypothetical protein
VIRRKMDRRHMIGDHHGRMTGRATPLVRAMDGILGTHRCILGCCTWTLCAHGSLQVASRQTLIVIGYLPWQRS